MSISFVGSRILALLFLAVAAFATYHLWPQTPLPQGARADLVVVSKAHRELRLLKDGEILKTYRIALGGEPSGHKQQEGDSRTPEGRYLLDWRNRKSGFHLSLHISYPNAADQRAASQRSVPPGGDIMIHGLPNGLGWIGRLHGLIDWTNGCIAVSNDEIEEIWRAVPNGTPIEINA